MRFLLAAVVAAVFVLNGFSALAADAIAGKKVWTSHQCPTCHGDDGNPELGGVPSFAKGERLEKNDGQLVVSIANGGNIMPAWKGVLSGADMINVIAFIRTLRK